MRERKNLIDLAGSQKRHMNECQPASQPEIIIQDKRKRRDRDGRCEIEKGIKLTPLI